MSDLQARVERLQAALAVMCYENGSLSEFRDMIKGASKVKLPSDCAEDAARIKAECERDIARLKAVTEEDCGPFAKVILG